MRGRNVFRRSLRALLDVEGVARRRLNHEGFWAPRAQYSRVGSATDAPEGLEHGLATADREMTV